MDPNVPSDFSTTLEALTTSLLSYYTNHSSSSDLTSYSPPRVLPSPSTLTSSRPLLHTTLPTHGHDLPTTTTHLLSLLPAFPRSSTTSSYYGFVTGGTTPAALIGDLIASTIDQNIQVHLPAESLATEVEQHALSMLLGLFRLPGDVFTGRCFTTGATGSNTLALAGAREGLVEARIRQRGQAGKVGGEIGGSVGELGMLEACRLAGIDRIQILSAAAHSSVAKAASIVGFGRQAVVDIAKPHAPWEVDLPRLEERLREAREMGWISIVVLGMGEVNTGRFPAAGEMREVVEMAGRFGGVDGGVWVHVDAAFGIFARALMNEEGWEGEVGRWADGLELVDSITGDGHKLLNVPYDCGFFFTRHPAHLHHTFVNTAPYLSSGVFDPTSIPSPLNMQLENSRRFRAFPVYATLTAYGAAGYRDLVRRLVVHAREIARFVANSDEYELLPLASREEAFEARIGKIFMVVLFRAKDEGLNETLKERINATGKMYVSGTVWDGRKAVRCAVGNWRVKAERDGEGGWGVAVEVLEEVARTFRQQEWSLLEKHSEEWQQET